jgi:hypothetical protein
LSVGIGDLAEPTSVASSKLQNGIGDFDKMMGALDVSNVSGARLLRDSAVRAMQDAASAYEVAANAAGNRILNPKPESDQEKVEIQFFQQNVARYGIQLPVSQKALVIATARIVRARVERLQSLDLEALAKNIRARQALVTESTLMQNFLVSATTMLRIG